MKVRLFFHYFSYLQYPVMLASLFFGFKSRFYGLQPGLENINIMLVLMGIGISFPRYRTLLKHKINFRGKYGKVLLKEK